MECGLPGKSAKHKFWLELSYDNYYSNQASYDNYYSNQDKFWTQGVAD